MRKNFFQKMNTLRNSGFTLVELLVSMTLTAIFATAVVAVMPSATRVYMQIEDMSRAQVVADMVVDALREECADTYIEDFASVRIVNPTGADEGDESFIAPLRTKVAAETTSSPTQVLSESSGSVLIIRKASGYCESIYSCLPITASNYTSVKTSDHTRIYDTGYTLGSSSRAVYRFFSNGTGTAETLPGYVHFGYYQCAQKEVTWTSGGSAQAIGCIYPKDRYDYTNPFSVDAYNGYTVSLEFSDLETSSDDYYLQRPLSVKVTVRVYKCDYAGQASGSALYTRTALLVFAEDTTK